MAAVPDKQYKVQWLPFQLNANASKAGRDKRQMYDEKFGPERVKQMIPHMQKVGKENGINFSYGGKTGNTFDSHRLILLAEQQGKDDAVVEELFRNYFEQEKYIGDMDVLEACAKKCQVEGFEKIKNDPEFLKKEIHELLQIGLGVGGVPHFRVNEKYEFQGAQDAEAFQELFAKL